MQARAPALQPGQPRLPGRRRKRRTIAPEAAFLQREAEQAEPVRQAVGRDAASLAEAVTGEVMAQAPGAPWVDPADQQIAARAHAARRLAQQAVGRQAEIQAVLQHHHVGGMLAQRPGLLLAGDVYAGQRRPQAHVAADLRRLRWFGLGRSVVHQIATEVARQLLIQRLTLGRQQQLAERRSQPLAGSTGQLQPLGIGLGERLFAHCHLHQHGTR